MRRNFKIFPENKILGEALKELRKERVLSALDFCKLINIKTGQLEKYENGTDLIPLNILEIIEEKLNLYMPKRVIRQVCAMRGRDDADGLSEIYKTLFTLKP